MGSRVDVTVAFRTKDFLKACIRGIPFSGCDSISLLNGYHPEGFVEVLFGDASNAEAGIEHLLKSHSIPFDRYWEGDGCDIEAGESFYRIDRSGPVEKSRDTASAWQIPFHELELAYEQDRVGDLIERTRDTFKVMSWDDQAAYLNEVCEKEERQLSDALVMLNSMSAADALKALDSDGVALLAQKILKVSVDPIDEDTWYAGSEHKVVNRDVLSKLIERGFVQMSLVRRIRHLHGIVNQEGNDDA